MVDLPPKIQAIRDIEDRAATLGAQRRDLNQGLEANTHAMIDLVRRAGGAGVRFEHLAGLLGVSRQTVFNWRELAADSQRGRTTRLTVRKAIVLAMKAFPAERIWRPAEVIAELEARGWLPEAKSAHQMVRNRMLSMAERGELEKRDPGGSYKLAADIRNTGLLIDDPSDQ